VFGLVNACRERPPVVFRTDPAMHSRGPGRARAASRVTGQRCPHARAQRFNYRWIVDVDHGSGVVQLVEHAVGDVRRDAERVAGRLGVGDEPAVDPQNERSADRSRQPADQDYGAARIEMPGASPSRCSRSGTRSGSKNDSTRRTSPDQLRDSLGRLTVPQYFSRLTFDNSRSSWRYPSPPGTTRRAAAPTSTSPRADSEAPRCGSC
jgi:hypothetical protein